MNNLPIIDQLIAIAASKAADGYLRSFRGDLDIHDRNALAESVTGQRFIWGLRQCGTALHPVARGLDPIWFTYWLDQGNLRDTPTLCYVVIVTEEGGASGDVLPITYERARSLAALPHPEGLVIKLDLFATRVEG